MVRGVVPVALIGLLAVPGVVLQRIYSGDLLLRLVLIAAVASVLLSLLVRRMPAWTAAPVSVAGLAALAAVAVKLSQASGQIDGALPAVARDALRNGIPRLLTALIPIQPQPDTVLVPVIATWLAGLAAAELAVRYQRVLLSYLMPTLLLGGALYLVGPNARPSLWLPLAFAGFAALGLAASGRDRSDEGLSREQRATLRLRLGAGAAAGLAIIIALGTAVGPSVAAQVGTVPTDPRRYVRPPELDSLDENPLVRLSGWALNPDQHLFDATVTGATTARIRLAVVSDFDGVTWRVGATYRAAGRVLTGPPADAPDEPTKAISQKIVIDELDGRLLPGAASPAQVGGARVDAAPAEVDGVRIAYDQATGTMALPDGLHPGLAYTVVARGPTTEVNLLPGAGVPTVARYVSLPGKVPDDISELAQQLGSAVTAPYQRAQAVEQFLAEHYTLVGDAPSGSAYPNVDYFLFGPRNGAGQRGASEQFAVAFAVLARALGLPTRIAIGFRVRAGANRVRGADALAWPEVLFDGLGWVDFNPLPEPNTVARPVEEDFRPKVDNSPPPPPATVIPPSASSSPRPKPAVAAAAPPTGRPPIAVIVGASTGALLALAVAGWLIVVPVQRSRLRRRRLTEGSPADRITGAWLEILDGLRLAGRAALPQLAATELVRYAAAAAGPRAHAPTRGAIRPPAPPIADLAAAANAVAFGPPSLSSLSGLSNPASLSGPAALSNPASLSGPASPASPAGVTSPASPASQAGAISQASEEAARRATMQAVAYVTALKASKPWWRRLLWTLDPRPLRWSRRADDANAGT